MKKLLLLYILFISLFSNAQCWTSLDRDGDTNSLHFAIQQDGSLWQLPPYGNPTEIGFQNNWDKFYTGEIGTYLLAMDGSMWSVNGQNIVLDNQDNWKELSISWNNLYGIKSNGTLWQNGMQVGSDNDWENIDISYDLILALKSNGTLWTGSIGNLPTQYGLDNDWEYIWAEEGEWFAIKSDGTLWYNGAQVGNDANWKLIKGHMYAGTYGIKTDGTLWYWPASFNPSNLPIQINPGDYFTDITFNNAIYAISESNELFVGSWDWTGSTPVLSLFSDANNLCSSASFLVMNDAAQNCNWGPGIEGINVLIEPGNIIGTTDVNGVYNSPMLPDGSYTATVDTTNLNWNSVCPTQLNFDVVNGFDPVDSNWFYLYNSNPCSDPNVSIFAPDLTRCFYDYIYVQACNQITATGMLNAAYVDIELDPYLTPTSSTIPFTNLGNNIYRFNLGDLSPGQCSNFSIYTYVSCNAQLGETLCMDATLFPAENCALDTIPSNPIPPTYGNDPNLVMPQPCTLPWDNSSLQVEGWCQGDSVYFSITNTGDFGNGDMDCYSPVFLYINDTLVSIDSVQIQGQQTVYYSYPANGQTFILNAEQHPLHPGNSHPNAHVELCGSDSTQWIPNMVNNLPLDDADPVVDIYCGVVTGSYDPNDKTGYPLGISDQHYIKPNQQLQYVVRFQNTGTDTAFTVVIRDTLDIDLNIFTVTPGVSSHDYTFQMYGPRVLEWRFDNILLPDSTTNEPESNGFITFTVEQVPNLPNGTLITNEADIYFDFNEPIITNETVHRINDMIQSSPLEVQEIISDEEKLITVYPNPNNGLIFIEMEDNSSPVDYTILDLNGRRVLSGKLNQQKNAVDLQHLKSGVYLIQVKGSNPVRIIKQ